LLRIGRWFGITQSESVEQGIQQIHRIVPLFEQGLDQVIIMPKVTRRERTADARQQLTYLGLLDFRLRRNAAAAHALARVVLDLADGEDLAT
jgi:hypothetical protein